MTASIRKEVTAALEEYCLEAQKALDESAKETAKLTQKQLKDTSPRGKGKGKYRRGWRVKKLETAGLVSYIVYNGAQPGLTHVLEHGHLARNQYGTFGRVRGIPHIGPANEEGIQRFELSCRARLRRLK